MNKQSLVLLAAAVSIVTMGVSCSSLNTISKTTEISTVVPVALANTNDSSEISYYLLNKPSTNNTFCNGVDMDSVGYKTALTEKITQSVPVTLTIEEKIKTTLGLAAEAQTFNDTYTRIENATFVNGIVTMRSANGWAGSSIFYCAWKPFVEKNLAQFPEVTEIRWAAEIEI